MPVDRDAGGVDLNLAARSGDIDVVRSLLRRAGTDLDARDILGDTGLLKASRYGHLEVVEELLVAGADVNAQDGNGWSCLHTSIANNREDVFFALLSGEHGSAPINIEAVTSSGDTCLHMAAFHGREWAIDTLLRLGSDRDATNDEGKRPVQVARLNAVRKILQPATLLPDEDDQSSAALVIHERSGGAANRDRQRGHDAERDNMRAKPADESYRSDPHIGGVPPEEEDVGNSNNGGRTSPKFEHPLCEAGHSRESRCVLDGDQLDIVVSLREHASASIAGDDRKIGGLFNGSIVSSLVPTAPEEDGNASFGQSACDPFFEEGSSEEESSLDSGGGLR